MSEALIRGLFLDETADEAAVDAFFDQLTERELLQEAISNCVYARHHHRSRAAGLDSVLQQGFLDDDRVDEELICAVCAALSVPPSTLESVSI